GKYPEKDYGESLREEQNRKWSLHNTAKGVNLFKEGRYVEAMQYFNHALQLDKYNVEALVARGALFANRDSLDKAIEDFEGALKLSSMHRNARKYLCQTLMAKAKQFEDKDDMSEAITLYEKVLTLNPGLKDAEESLRYVREKKEHFRKRQQLLEKQESQNKNPPEKKSLMEMSRDTLKKLLIAEKVKRKERKKRKKDKSKKKKEEKMKQKGESRKRRHSRKFSSDESDEMVVVEENIDMHRFSDSRHRSMEKRGKRKSRSHSKESDVMVINEGRERRNSEKSSVSGHERGHEHRSLDSSSCNSTKVEESRRKSFGGYSPELPRRFKRTISDHGFSKEKQISHDVCTPSLVKDTVKASERTYALLKVKDKYMESRSTSRRARRDSHRSEKSDDHSKSDGLIKRPRRDSQGTGQPLDLLLSGRYRDSSDSVGFSEVLCAVQSSSKTGRSYDRKVEVVKNASYDRESEGTNLHSKGKRSRHPLGCVGEAFTRKDNRYSSSDIFSDRSSHKADWCEVEDRSPTKNKPHSSTDYSSEEDYRESGSKAQSTRGHKLSRSSSFSSESRDLRRNRSSSAEYNNRKRSSTSSLEEHVKIHKNTEKQRLYPDYKASSSSKKKSLLEKTSPSDTHFGTKGRDNAGVYNKAVIQSTRLVEIPAVKSRWEDTKDLSKDVHEDKHAKLGKEVRSRYERECCEQTPKAPRGYVKENETKKERISSKEYTRTVSKLEDDDLDDMLPKAYQVNRNTNPVRQRHFGEKHSNLEKGHKYYKRETSESYKSRRHENWNQECKEKDACRSNWNKDRKRKIDDTDDARERNVGKYENQKVNRDDRKCNSFPQSSPENKKLKRGEGYDISVKDEPKRESERKDKESSKMGQSFNTLWMEVIQQYESEGSDSGNSAPSNDAREAEQKYANRDRRSYESHREYDRTWERDKSNSGNRHNSGKNKGSPEKKRYR
uniref:Tetratricopeptide repeat protein 14 homolog n=1 Tax=Saccoglossus kowalevskii TaxID=10224 RepID=A0ABM0MZM5_SACKO